MKKLFVCAMALAAFVSCSKDDIQGPALDSANKSVSITILNGSGSTRADGDAGVTAPGVGENGGTTMASAEAADLDVLFADAAGNVVYKRSLVNNSEDDATDTTHDPDHEAECVPGTTGEQNTYIWHNVDWSVTQIAVVRTNGTEADNFETLDEYLELATSEAANLTRELDEIVLYGVDAQLEDLNETHEVDGISYHYWKAEVIVAPALARFEIINIECEDLGVLNADNDNRTYGFDELIVKSLTWNSTATAEGGDAFGTYQIAPAPIGTLYGRLAKEGTYTGSEDRTAGEADDVQPANGDVWSWNVLPSTFTGMTVQLEATAYNYTLTEAGKNLPLTVTGLSSTQAKADAKDADANAFVAGNIYQLNLKFKEGNLADDDALCIQVEVTINPWTIKTVYPVFGNN